jgi:ribosome recycling factor
MKDAVQAAQVALSALDTTRISPELLSRVSVRIHGGSHPLKSVAQIHSAGPRELLITPYDPGSCTEIERAIGAADLGGVAQRDDAQRIRFSLSADSQERRDRAQVEAKRVAQGARVQIRQIRTEAIQRLGRDVKAGKLVVPQQRARTKQLQAACDEASAAVDLALAACLQTLQEIR